MKTNDATKCLSSSSLITRKYECSLVLIQEVEPGFGSIFRVRVRVRFSKKLGFGFGFGFGCLKKVGFGFGFGFGYFKKSEFGFGSGSGSVQFMNFHRKYFYHDHSHGHDRTPRGVPYPGRGFAPPPPRGQKSGSVCSFFKFLFCEKDHFNAKIVIFEQFLRFF